MKKNKDYEDEESLNRINELLEKSDLKNIIGEDVEINNELIEKQENDEFSTLEEETYPGLLKFRMDGFKMHLFMEIKAPLNSTNKIEFDDIKIELEKYGSFCEEKANWEIIRDVYSRVLFEGEIIPEVKIATGTVVQFTIPEHIIIREDLNTDYKPQILEGDRVDFHHIKSFLIVGKNENLGHVVLDSPGIEGKDLLGNIIPSPKKFINNLSIGDNIISKNGKIYSEIDGAFKIVKDKITVDPVLDVPDDVDYSTGDIEFKGDINVSKSIREGFAVTVGRDIYVGESIEPVNIKCGNSIFVKHGIIGSDKYIIECSGTINSLHIENAHIKSDGSVTVRNSITHAKIYCLDKLLMEESSSIIGGIYYIQNGIITGNIGNKLGIETYINLGIDFKVEDKLKLIQKTSAMLITEINTIQDKIDHSNNKEEKYKLKYIFLSLRNRQNSLNNYARSLLSKLDKNDKSKLVVHGTIYPGTYIEICHVSYIVKRELTRIKFYLNKEIGEIEYSSI